MKEESHTTEPQMETDSSMLETLSSESGQLSVTPELALKNKKKTCITSQCISEMDTQTQNLLQTSEVESISKEKVFKPYWNEQCAENVSLLLSHTEIDWLGLTSTSLNGLSQNRVGKSWCLTKWIPALPKNLQQTSWLLSRFSQPDCTDLGNTRIRSRQILLKPTKIQRQLLASWAGSYRKVYNLTVQAMKKHYEETGTTASYMKMRKQWTEEFQKEMSWWKDIPAHTLYGAMMDAEQDYKLVVKRRAKGLKTELPVCRRKTQRSFFILGGAVTERGIYPRRLGPLKTGEPLPEKPMDSRIIFEAGKWWISIPEKKQIQVGDNQARVCSVDPGVRTFLSIFSPEGIGKIHQGGFGRITRLAQHLDDLISRTATEKNSQSKRRMQLAQARMRLKIRNLINDLHYQAISFLFNKFDTIIIPNSNFTSATSKANRKIRSKTVRSLMGYAFARFRDRLKHKAELFGKQVIVVCEAYTSKTHNITGEIIQNLGGRKFIVSQGIKVDRDINGALGIFLKALLDQPEIVGENPAASALLTKVSIK